MKPAVQDRRSTTHQRPFVTGVLVMIVVCTLVTIMNGLSLSWYPVVIGGAAVLVAGLARLILRSRS